MNAGELHYLARRLRACADEALGAGPGQVEAVPPLHQLVLGCVLDSPRISVGEIARRLSVVQSAVSKAVAACREQGLVVTDADPEDRRVTRVAPSPRLARWAGTCLQADVEEVMAPVLAGLPARDRACVLRALALMHDAFARQDGRSR